MTRAQVLELINNNIATGSNITAAEHKAVEIALLDFIPANISSIKCYGRIGPVDIKGTATTYTCSFGNIVSASKITPAGDYQPVRVVMPSGSFTDTNYKVRIDVESGPVGGGDVNNNIRPVVFQKINSTTFDICLEELTVGGSGDTQDLYFHIEVVALAV